MPNITVPPTLLASADKEQARATKAEHFQRWHASFVADELEAWNGVAMNTAEAWALWTLFLSG